MLSPGHVGDARDGPGLLAHRTASLPALVPARHAYEDLDDPVTNDWNHSFLPRDVTASAAGLAAPYLLRCGGTGGFARHRASWGPLMLVSLALTSTAGLQAVVLWALRGDWSVTWWVPERFLLLFPVPSVVLLMRQEAGAAAPGGGDAVRAAAEPGIQSPR
ncbi:DUF5360 family protein [Streptomyces xantholiticus]|uniref:DUF5360 family protein n=1 Tax=Streptomyces xantholiticus TaxID=68285 RepID=A0ABV1UQR4_9ACTN